MLFLGVKEFDVTRLEDYMLANKKMARFGMKYLDDRLGGILRGDLILIGARSGAGKSTIAEIIATANSRIGKKVTLISLENFKDDNFVQKAYYKYKELTKQWGLTLRDFASGDFERDAFAIVECEKFAENEYKNISMVNRSKDFTIEDLKEALVRAVEDENSDLVIVDHIDYLDKESGVSDNEHITSLMREIRAAQYAFKIPVVAISHLRKVVSSKAEIIVPSMDEFVGSSNKVKEATCVIMLAPNDEENVLNNSPIKSTWCCVRKLRMGGIDNKVAKVYFDQRQGVYVDRYELYGVNYAGTKVVPIYPK